MQAPTNPDGTVATCLPVSDFQPGHTEFACGPFGAATCAWATAPNTPNFNSVSALISWAEAEYAKINGDNGPNNNIGSNEDNMHTYFTDTQTGENGLTPNKLYWQEMSPLNFANIKTAIQWGYIVLPSFPETSVLDRQLNANPYWWGPSDDHIAPIVGITRDNNYLVNDYANVSPGSDRDLQTPKTPLPWPRKYDASRLQLEWATIIRLPWTPPIPNGDPSTWPPYTGAMNMNIEQQATDIWAQNPVQAPTDTNIFKSWHRAYVGQQWNFGFPTTQEFNTVDWNGKPIKVQYFSAGVRAESSAGTTRFYDVGNRIVFTDTVLA